MLYTENVKRFFHFSLSSMMRLMVVFALFAREGPVLGLAGGTFWVDVDVEPLVFISCEGEASGALSTSLSFFSVGGFSGGPVVSRLRGIQCTKTQLDFVNRRTARIGNEASSKYKPYTGCSIGVFDTSRETNCPKTKTAEVLLEVVNLSWNQEEVLAAPLIHRQQITFDYSWCLFRWSQGVWFIVRLVFESLGTKCESPSLTKQQTNTSAFRRQSLSGMDKAMWVRSWYPPQQRLRSQDL